MALITPAEALQLYEDYYDAAVIRLQTLIDSTLNSISVTIRDAATKGYDQCTFLISNSNGVDYNALPANDFEVLVNELYIALEEGLYTVSYETNTRQLLIGWINGGVVVDPPDEGGGGPPG